MLEGSILQQLRDAHRSGNADGKRSLNFGVYYKNTLVALCHALEDAILAHDHEPLMITAFQRGKWYLQEADRYGEIAEKAPQIVILASGDAGFQEHPTSQRENVALVTLDASDPVAQEWHLVIASPNYTAMVLCQELSEADYETAGAPRHDLERKFYGLWTFESRLVLETIELLIAHVARYNSTLHQQLREQLEAIATQIQQAPPSDLSTITDLGDIASRVVDYLQNSQHIEIRGQDWGFGALTHLDDNLTSNELQAFLRIAQLLDQTDLSNPMAAAEVAALAEAMGQLLDLPAWQLHRLRLAGLLHRIALLQTVGTELQPSMPRYGDDPVAPSCALVPGVQVLRTMQRLKAIATILTHQQESWDGRGYPAGLAGDEIPLESRILGLVSCFQQRLAIQGNGITDSGPEALSRALTNCQDEQGDRWDPKLVEILSLLVNGLQQGLSLAVTVPRIAAGLWLLDSHAEDDLLGTSDSFEASSTP